MSLPLSERLAVWFAALDWRSLPPRQRELARLRLLDTVGLLLGGLDGPASAILRARVGRDGAAGVASIVGLAAPAPATWAALTHGVIAHCLDYDDTFPDSVVHPGSAVVPVALAVGEAVGAAGAEILTAIAGGYEIAARLAQVGGRCFHERGFHPSGVFAPIAAAFVAARLMHLEPRISAGAVGLAASMSGGLLAFMADGAWSKWLHLGWGGFGGVLAAELAASGFRGPLAALDGRFNLYGAFLAGTPCALDGIDQGLGEAWRGDGALFKLYPCAHVIQPYIDLALNLRRLHRIEPAAVQRVGCAVAPWAVPIVCEPVAEKLRPRSAVEAIASLPYHVATALLDGSVGREALSEASFTRPNVAALAGRVHYTIDPALERFSGALEIELSDGRRFSAAGAAAEPDGERLGRKFAALAAPVLPADRAQRLAEVIAGFAEAPDAAPLGALLREAAATPAGAPRDGLPERDEAV